MLLNYSQKHLKKYSFRAIILVYATIRSLCPYLANLISERYGLFMAKEAVLRVKNAEEEARKIISDANLEAKKMVEDAKATSLRECEELENNLSLEYKERVKQVKTDSKELIEESLMKTKRRTASMERHARLNMPVAVRYIARRIVGECQ